MLTVSQDEFKKVWGGTNQKWPDGLPSPTTYAALAAATSARNAWHVFSRTHPTAARRLLCELMSDIAREQPQALGVPMFKRLMAGESPQRINTEAARTDHTHTSINVAMNMAAGFMSPWSIASAIESVERLGRKVNFP